MIHSFKDDWLEVFYFHGVEFRQIPTPIVSALLRKLDLMHAARGEQDLRIPPGNRFEHLDGKLKGWCSIRVNKQYRLIFKWSDGQASQVYLDPHRYR